MRLALLSLLLAGGVARAAGPETAKLELIRYLGTWYEVARFDEYFERGCVGVIAQYTMLDETNVRVVNQCFKGSLEGEKSAVEGKAWVPDPNEPGKLKVRFFWPFKADYWVLEVAPDYSWALVGNATKSSCWVLSRTPQMSDELYDSLLAKLDARGYDTKKLLKVLQPKKP